MVGHFCFYAFVRITQRQELHLLRQEPQGLQLEGLQQRPLQRQEPLQRQLLQLPGCF